jgi:hypothetical protein
MTAAARLFGVGVLTLAVGVVAVQGQEPVKQDRKAQEMVRVAAQTELNASKADNSHWEYKDVDNKADGATTVTRVVETEHGAISRKIEVNGRPVSAADLKREDARIDEFVRDPAQQAKQRKDGAQDDKRAENMTRMLPDAFLWSVKSDSGNTVTLGFVPNPDFTPPTMESRVFATMAGEIVVNKAQNRIQTIKGALTDDVKFGWGILGKMDKGGTFDVERRELMPNVWQITESHVHIGGHALLFKSIGEQDDEVKSEFRRVPGETTLEQAAVMLKGEPQALSASR